MLVNPNKSTIHHSSVLSTYISPYFDAQKPYESHDEGTNKNQPPCFCFGLRTPKGHEAMPKCRQLPGSRGHLGTSKKWPIFDGGYHGQKIGITLGQSLDFNLGKVYHQQLAQWLHTQPRPSMEINMKPPLNNMINTYPIKVLIFPWSRLWNFRSRIWNVT